MNFIDPPSVSISGNSFAAHQSCFRQWMRSRPTSRASESPVKFLASAAFPFSKITQNRAFALRQSFPQANG
jgi:hypothetical protein